MTTTLLSTEDLIKIFNKATFDGDIRLIDSLLDENGVYEIQDKDLEVIDVKKEEFLNWYEEKLSQTSILESTFDLCIGCSFGNQVLIFNDGMFPKTPKDITERSKSGLMIESNDGKINKIAFCSIFLKTENKYGFECLAQFLKKHRKDGITSEQAIELFNSNKNYNHIKFEPDNQNLENDGDTAF